MNGHGPGEPELEQEHVQSTSGEDSPEAVRRAALIAALNDQAMGQVNNLSHGPLALGALQALGDTVARVEAGTLAPNTIVGFNVLQARVLFEGRLYLLEIGVAVRPL